MVDSSDDERNTYLLPSEDVFGQGSNFDTDRMPNTQVGINYSSNLVADNEG